MADNNFLHPHDCPYTGDHDTIVAMAEQIKAVHFAIYDAETGILGSFRKLNGRVKKLEVWRAGLVGSLAVMIPILIYLAERVMK